MTAPLTAVKNAVVAKLTALYPNAQVSYGEPGQLWSQDLIYVTDAIVEVAYGPFGRQQHDINLDVTFSSFQFGDESAQQTATEGALAMQDGLDAFLRANGTDPFGLKALGLQQVEWAKLARYVLEETANTVNTPDGEGVGRQADVRTTIQINVRP